MHSCIALVTLESLCVLLLSGHALSGRLVPSLISFCRVLSSGRVHAHMVLSSRPCLCTPWPFSGACTCLQLPVWWALSSRSGFSPGCYLVLGVSFKVPLCSCCLYIRSCISFGLCGSDGFSGLGNCGWREWSVQPLRVCSFHLFCLPLHHFRRDPFWVEYLRESSQIGSGVLLLELSPIWAVRGAREILEVVWTSVCSVVLPPWTFFWLADLDGCNCEDIS